MTDAEGNRENKGAMDVLSERPKWLIALCLGGWIAALLIATFSCGIYIGRYGLSRAGLVLERPAGNRPQGMPPQGGGPAHPGAAPGERPALVGRVRAVSDDRLELATPDGVRPVTLTDDTIVLGPDREQITVEDLHEDMTVAIFGRMQQLGELIAERVEVLPAQNQQPPP